MKRDLFVIIDAIRDGTWGQEQYKRFREQYGFNNLKFKSLDKELGVELADTYLFAQKEGRIYLLRCVETRYMGLSSTDDTWTAAVIEEKESIPLLQYPKIMQEVDRWIEENKKSFE